MGMKLPLIPDNIKTFINLWPALSLIYEALEHGAQKAVEYFESETADSPDPFLAPDLVRWHAKRLIVSRANQLEVDVKNVVNIGLRLVYDRQALWIVKTPDGDLPPPKSTLREEYYSQVLPLLVDPNTGSALLKPNMVILWTASRDFKTISLKLTCPKEGDVLRAISDSYWEQRIPHPAELISFAMPSDADATTPEELSAIEHILFKKVQGED
jgi:hypothetical protein